ncbi:MlaE family ABC transporter permease [Desulfobulbus alkaliphilus]|uniref:MlaE family ABC transporter permease n=1 Tax=Desulfobulbus alkaliphilus TaxID=869814 RepID=UPI0019664B69|nr:ABC transporter permease [Desulfobulbus alkaliphilus]MBM9538218.1 ABC transporter permease [Desulfobulbus alkaliphilus]
MPPDQPSPLLSFQQTQPGHLAVSLAGAWTLKTGLTPSAPLLSAMDESVQRLTFVTVHLTDWDTGLPVFLKYVIDAARKRGISVELSGLPQGVQRLLTLAAVVPEKVTYEQVRQDSLVTGIGRFVIDLVALIREVAAFTGEIVQQLLLLLRGKPPFRPRDFFYFVQNCGIESLPIVSLIAVLVGVILAFVGAVQLQMFGAQIYVANLVGLGMVMEMGALMSGVIIAGRIGAAYAAQLGTMQVNEEIDALRTMGISPVGFLVLPRMLALMLMLPLLCVFANLMGILGGSIIGITMLDLALIEYIHQTRSAIELHHFGHGLLKSSVFGVLIAFAGCLRGMQCGRSALAVDIEQHPAPSLSESTPSSAEDAATRIQQLIDQGLRAQLRLGSLLLGTLYIDLDFYPKTEVQFHCSDPGLIAISQNS